MPHKLSVTIIAAIMVGLLTEAQTIFSPYTRCIKTMTVASNQPERPISKQSSSANRDGSKSGYIPAIIKLEPDSHSLPGFAYEMHRRGNLVLAQIDADSIAKLADYNYITRVETSPAAEAVMDHAREFCNLPEIQQPVNQLPPLSGAGVVTGFCDTGFQPSHINFLTPDGEPRVKRIVNYTLESRSPETVTAPESILAWGTDNADETHATHVAGIMAGSYEADGYQGIAPDADIVATTSPLYDAYLLDGCEQILDYANAVGKPAVINMSVVSEIGPHDGTSLFNQYIDKITDEAPVCISAGNSGNRACYIRHRFSADKPTIRTYPRQWPSWSPLEAHGMIDIWSADSRSITVNVVGWDENSKSIAYRWDGDAVMHNGDILIICSEDLAGQYPNHAEPLLPSRFSGYIYLAAEVNPENGRYNVAFVCDVKDVTTDDHYAAAYRFGPEITGQPGQEVEIYASSRLFFLSPTDPLATNGNASRSVNDLCTGNGAISVGAMTSRNTWPTITGDEGSSPDLVTGAPANFSSYGTLNDGSKLPHICAPGATVISSISSPYVDAHPEVAAYACQRHDIDGKTYYWRNDQGTSMSSPFAAGVVALWLQANPHLTGKEIKEIMLSTASAPTADAENPQWGHGLLDAAAGLDLACEMAGNHPTRQAPLLETDKISVKRTGLTEYTFSWGHKIITDVRIIDMSGREAIHVTGRSMATAIDCTHLQKAIYIAQIAASDGTTQCSKLVLH